MKDKTITFFRKYGTIFLLLIPIFLSIVFRMYPASLPIVDVWAENQVDSFYKSQVEKDVASKYPNLPATQFNALVKNELAKYEKENADLIEQQKLSSAETIRSKFKNENGNTYLLAIDPYTFYRQTENLVETGNHYDELRNGQPWNNHIVAPLGKPMKERPDAHVLFQYYLYKVVHTVNKNVDLMAVVFYVPIIISMLSIFPAFFITRKMSGPVGGLVASIIVAVHPVFLSRTPGGFADTDAYNVFFPLCILWFAMLAFYSPKVEMKFVWATVCSLVLGIYGAVWTNWLMFDMLLGSIGVYIVYELYRTRKRNFKKVLCSDTIKYAFMIFGIILLLGPIFTYAMSQQNLIQIGIMSPLRIANTFKSASKDNYWPNVYLTVAELNEVGYGQVISQIGFNAGGEGKLFFIMALAGIVVALFNKHNRWLAILLCVWFVGTMYGSTKGIRFLLLLVPAFAVALGTFFGFMFNYLQKMLTKEFNIDKLMSQTVLLTFIIIVMFIPISQADDIATQQVPSMNDAWYDSLTKIKHESAPDAIINSWWDFGHWFKAVADRGVSFDGGSQNNPMAHWIGKVLLTEDEREAVGILRMLDCSSDNAVYYIQDNIYNGDIDDSINLINKLVLLNNTDAWKYLEQQGINDNHKRTILDMTHCTPPENYFITSGDMVMKAGVWAHFGSWDFEKAQLWQNVKGMEFDDGVEYIMKNFSKTEKRAEELYYEIQSLSEGRNANSWIAPWPSYVSGEESCTKEEDVIKCNNGLVINTTKNSVYVNTQQGKQILKSIGFVNEGSEFGITKFENNDIDISAVITPSGKSVLMQPQLTGSMFTRLFFMDSIGLNHFEKFSDKTSISGDRIIVWKINWEGIKNE